MKYEQKIVNRLDDFDMYLRPYKTHRYEEAYQALQFEIDKTIDCLQQGNVHRNIRENF